MFKVLVDEAQKEPKDYLSTLPFDVFQRILYFSLIKSDHDISCNITKRTDPDYEEYLKFNADVKKFASLVNESALEMEDYNDFLKHEKKITGYNAHFLKKNVVAVLKLAQLSSHFGQNIEDFKQTELGKWIVFYLLVYRQTKRFIADYVYLNQLLKIEVEEERKENTMRCPNSLKTHSAIGLSFAVGSLLFYLGFWRSFAGLSFGSMGIVMAVNVAVGVALLLSYMAKVKYFNNQDGYLRSAEAEKKLESMKKDHAFQSLGMLEKEVEALLQNSHEVMNNKAIGKNLEDMKKQLKQSVKELVRYFQEFNAMTFCERKDVGQFNKIRFQLLLLMSLTIQVIKALAIDMLDIAGYQRERASSLLWKDLLGETGNPLSPAPSEPSLVLY